VLGFNPPTNWRCRLAFVCGVLPMVIASGAGGASQKS